MSDESTTFRITKALALIGVRHRFRKRRAVQTLALSLSMSGLTVRKSSATRFQRFNTPVDVEVFPEVIAIEGTLKRLEGSRVLSQEGDGFR